MIVWQLTGGETWLHLNFLSQLSTWLETLRNSIGERIFAVLPEPHGSLLGGIIFGNKVQLDKDLVDAFRVVGLTHIIAVSGYNLTILSKNAETLLRGWLGRKAMWVSLGLILFFVIITGAPASILRAAVMATTIIWARMIGRPSRSVNLLILAAGVLAIFEPKIVFSIGFQLSVVATYALVRLAPIINIPLSRLPIPNAISSILAETLAATLLTAPLIVAYFERLSIVSPLTNILVLPLIPLLMGLGIIGIILLFSLPPLGKLAIFICWPILQWIISVTGWFAELPWAATSTSLGMWWTVALMVAIIVGVEMLNRLAEQRQPDLLAQLEVLPQ